MALLMPELTDRCNFNCTFCRSQEQRGYRDIDFDKCIEVLREAQNCNIYGNWFNEIQLNGNGESLLYARIADVVREAKKLFDSVETTTNGYFLTEDIAEALLNAGIDKLCISLTGITTDVYSKFQGSGISLEQCEKNLDRVINNVIALVKKRNELNKKTLIVLRYIKSDDSRKHLKEYTRFWRKHGADAIFVTELWDFYRTKGKFKHCNFTPRRTTVRASGQVLLCACSLNSTLNQNVYDKSFSKILQSEEYVEEKKRMMTNDENILTKSCFACQYRRYYPLRWDIKNMREKIFLQKPLKNLLYKLYGPAVILLDRLNYFKSFYTIWLFFLRITSNMRRRRFQKRIKNEFSDKSQ